MSHICLKIADIPYAITCRNKKALRLIKKGFKGFLSVKPKTAVKINVIINENLSKNPYEYGKPHFITVNDLGSCITVNGSSFKGWVNLKSKTSEVTTPISESTFYLFLRFVASLIISLNQGIMLHASSVTSKGVGYIFAGRPNTGKSTIAGLSSDHTILSDDFSIIKKIKNEYRVFPSPFWGKIRPKGKSNNDSYPIKGIYSLNHSDENFIRSFKSSSKKLFFLHQNVLLFASLHGHCNNVFKTENDIIRKVPLYKLYFIPHNSVWRCINDSESCL